MKGKKRKDFGILIIVIGVLCLFVSLYINHNIDIDDSLCIFLLAISLLIELFGLFKVIKETR